MQVTPSKSTVGELHPSKQQALSRQSSVRREGSSPNIILTPLTTGFNSEAGSTSSIDILPLNPFDCEGNETDNIDLFPLSSFQFMELAAIGQEQVDFCIRQFKACIPQLILQNRSPFIHPSSHTHTSSNMYQDLLGVCAMYNQKTPQNQTVIFSMLNYKISSLIAASNSSSWLIEDYLLGVQALILYQIIRLFDGDIRLRANGERHFATLETWTKHLQSTGNIYANETSSNKSLYQRWVFIESTRRTVLMSVLLQGLYSLLKDGVCDSVPLMATLPVSVNGALWDMSEEDWWQSSLGVGSELLTYHEFTTQWNGGKQFHKDVYETMLLVACRHTLKPPPLIIL
jgi:hypothetical protein